MSKEETVIQIIYNFILAFIVDIKGCARCGGDHQGLEFKEINTPIPDIEGDFTHWALCPHTNDPVLLRITKNDDPT